MKQKIKMKKGFITIAVGIGLVSAMIGAVLIYNYIPIGWFKYLDFSQPLIGTTVTDISTATRFADFPAIYNANNLALNNGKIEVSTTTLPLITTLAGLTTVGTITSGTWNASTLTVGYGGTGSTTLSAYHVLLGNGTGNIGVVSGLGTSGMSLVSGGAGAAPTWQSVGFDTTDDYSLTGNWNFLGTTLVKNLNASSTVANPIYLNGIDYAFPSTEGASSTILATNGNGGLTWETMSTFFLMASSTNTRLASEAVTTNNTGTYTKTKDIEIIYDGVLKVYFELYSANTNGQTYGQVYINGVATGTASMTTSTAWPSFTYNFQVSALDNVQLYQKRTDLGGAGDSSARNFRLQFDLTPSYNWGTVVQ